MFANGIPCNGKRLSFNVLSDKTLYIPVDINDILLPSTEAFFFFLWNTFFSRV